MPAATGKGWTDRRKNVWNVGLSLGANDIGVAGSWWLVLIGFLHAWKLISLSAIQISLPPPIS